MPFRPVARTKSADPGTIDTSSTNIGTGAYVEIIASTSKAASAVHCSNTSAVAMIVAIGAALAEVDLFHIAPGYSGVIPMEIAKGKRVTLKSTKGTISSGVIVLNFLG